MDSVINNLKNKFFYLEVLMLSVNFIKFLINCVNFGILLVYIGIILVFKN